MTLSFNLAPGVALGDAVTAIEAAVGPLGLPAGIHGSFQGTAQIFQASLASQPLLIASALLAVYVVLGMLYESYIHPLTILSTLPSAGVGALLALLACRTELTVIALIGILLLVGIVKKNAIMMIDFAPGGGTGRGQEPGGGDLPGVRAALPADHDDHDGRASGRAAAGPRGRHRVGAAAAPRDRHRRRAHRQPGAHALHDTGRVPLPRRRAVMVGAGTCGTWGQLAPAAAPGHLSREAADRPRASRRPACARGRAAPARQRLHRWGPTT